MDTILKNYREELLQEVNGNILPFWLQNVVDRDKGIIYGSVSRNREPVSGAVTGAVMCARIIWTMSHAFIRDPRPEYKRAAAIACDFFIKYFWDTSYGGVYWSIKADLSPALAKKQTYAQAFALYAFSEYYRAFKKQPALDLALTLFELIEKHCYDRQNEGYLEACSVNWGLTESMSLSDKDLNAPKSMNTHLHILEAYTNFLRVKKFPALQKAQTRLLQTMLKFIINPRQQHFQLFFNKQWESLSSSISPGHGIEGSWLIVEAAGVLEDNVLLQQTQATGLKMAAAVADKAIDARGSLIPEIGADGSKTVNREWWPQAEGMVGFVQACLLNGEKKYLQASLDLWQYIKKYLIDSKYGGWYWGVDKNGEPYNLEKAGLWKCPYHNARACWETADRLNKILEN